MSDPGNTLSTATSLSLTTSQTFSNSVSSSDIDFFRLNFTRSSNLNVNLRLSSGSADLALIRDRNGNGVIDSGEIVAQSVNERGLTELINLTRLDPGEYYLQVAVKAGDASIANYILEATAESLKRSPATIDWRDANTGALTIWAVNDTAIETTRTYTEGLAGWQIAARGDFNGDGNTDLFWRHANGGTSIWLMSGAEILSAVTPATVGTEWQVKFVGDLNGDSKEDLFWQHVSSGEASLWTLDGTITTGGRLINFGPGWQLVGVGDFNANGKTDWIWQHPIQGLVTQELLDGLTQGESRTWNVAGNWQLQTTADFNGDRRSDLIWQTPTGEIAFWLMQGLNIDTTGFSVAQAQQFTPNYSASWKLQETGDFDGDGKTDLLWGNQTTGEFSVWLMNGYAVKSASTHTLGGNWRVQGVVDLNGDGKSDIIWHNPSGRQAVFWLMNGTAAGNGAVFSNVEASWQADVRKTLGNLPQPIDEAGNSLQTAFKAGTIGPRGHYNGRLSRQDTSDLYEFVVPPDAIEAGYRYNFELVSNTTTLEFTLLDQEGRVIQRSDSMNRGLDAIQTRLAPGTYYLQVSADAGTIVQPSEYRLNLNQIVTPIASPPKLDSIAPITVRLGETREIKLSATDSDGDLVSFTIRHPGTTSPVTLSPDGKLVIKPLPGQQGNYTFEVIASDSQGSSRQTVTLQVNPDSDTRTRVTGRIFNNNKQALAGLTVRSGNTISTTDANGQFTLVFNGSEQPGTDLVVQGRTINSTTYQTATKTLQSLLGRLPFLQFSNTIEQPIYLNEVDPAYSRTIQNPATDTVTITNPLGPDLGGITIPAGTINRTGQTTITLSKTEIENTLITVRDAAGELVTFEVAIALALAVGTDVPFTTNLPVTMPVADLPFNEWNLLRLDSRTGEATVVGAGTRGSGGNSNRVFFPGGGLGSGSGGFGYGGSGGGVGGSGIYLAVPRPIPPTPIKDIDRNPEEICNGCRSTRQFTSDVELHSGILEETHRLVTYQAQGETRGLRLRYNSMRADPRPIVHFNHQRVPASSRLHLIAQLFVKDGNYTYQLPGYTGTKYGLRGGEHIWSVPEGGGEVGAALQVDMRSFATGQYDYTLVSGIKTLYDFN